MLMLIKCRSHERLDLHVLKRTRKSVEITNNCNEENVYENEQKCRDNPTRLVYGTDMLTRKINQRLVAAQVMMMKMNGCECHVRS